MNRSIRKLVGGGAAALALGGFFALIVAPMLAGAFGGSHETLADAGVAGVVTKLRTVGTSAIDKKVVATVHPAVAPAASCTTAKANLAAAVASDKAEDAAEKAHPSSATEVAEDKAEYAARKPLVDAVRTACGFTLPTPSPACASALQSLKTAFQTERGEDEAERTAGTEGSPSDVTEDQSEKARLAPLWTAVRNACGFGTRTHDFSVFGSTKSWSFQH
jgi:hypothetical protein